nr:DUF4838 domain-containing protein [Terrimicrobiaceae bacterium]
PSIDGEAALPLVFENGASDYEIVVAGNASAAAREGAGELQRLIGVATGTHLSLVAEPTVGRKQIVVGAHPLALEVGLDAAKMAADAYEIRVEGNSVFMLGRDDANPDVFSFSRDRTSSGTYFAVIEFANRFLGAEWYMPGPLGEEIPERKGLSIPRDLRLAGKPFFPIRLLDVTSILDNEAMRKMGLDADNAREAARWGRRLRLGASFRPDFQHAWFLWMPAEEPNTWGGAPRTYGAEHPEYFALVNGKRTNFYRDKSWHAGAQLCVSNPEVVRVFSENIIAYARRTGERYFSLSENDGGDHCECEQCRAWDVVEGDPSASPGIGDQVLTDRIFRFANEVAERVLKEVPDARFGLYAYHNTLSPPRKVKLNDAIIVSDVYNSWPWQFHSEPSRRVLEEGMRKWREQSKHIVLTSYYFNNGYNWSMPWSTLDAQAEWIGLISESSASLGLRLEYGYGDGPALGVLGPDPWVVSQLLWNPHQSVEDLSSKFYLGAFGPQAGPLIRRYFEIINESLAGSVRSQFHKPVPELYITKTAPLVVPAYEAVRAECRSLIDQAEEAVRLGPERYRWRVDKIVRGWRYAELTLDAVAASREARSAEPHNRKAAWEKAIRLGKQREAMRSDRKNGFSLARSGIDAEAIAPLGVVTEVPVGDRLTLSLPLINEPVPLNGKLDAPVWRKAARSTKFKENYNQGITQAATRVLGFYSEEGLYLGFHCKEPSMSALNTVDDPSRIWSGDVVEVFLVPPGDSASYLQFSVNPNSVGKENRGADLEWKTAWKYAASKNSDSWTAEIFIPWKSLGLSVPPTGSQGWMCGFFRERFTEKTELSAWSPTGTSFGTPLKFGRLEFSP